MSDSNLLLGKRIRLLRRQFDYTQENLAESAKISVKYLSEIERGKANLSLEILENLAGAFSMPLVDLLEIDQARSKDELKADVDKIIAGLNEAELAQVYRVLKALYR